MKKSIRLLALCTVLVLTLLVSSCLHIGDIFKVYTYDDITQYRKDYPISRGGDYDIQTHIDPVFPEEIEPFFTVQAYSYKMCHEPVMHELFLEVTIEDEETYQSYKQELVGEKELIPFKYDATFEELTVSDLVTTQHEGEWIGYTVVQKTLFSNETRTIIFVSIYLPYSDMPLPVTDFAFFNRFGLTAVESTRNLIQIN